MRYAPQKRADITGRPLLSESKVIACYIRENKYVNALTSDLILVLLVNFI